MCVCPGWANPPGRLCSLLRLPGLGGSAAAASSARSSAALLPREGRSFLPARRRQQLKEEQGAQLLARVGGGLERRPKASELELASHRLLLPCTSSGPQRRRTFCGAPAPPSLPFPEANVSPSPAGRGQGSPRKVVAAQAPDGGASTEAQLSPGRPLSPPHAGPADPLRPREQRVQPPRAHLCLPEPAPRPRRRPAPALGQWAAGPAAWHRPPHRWRSACPGAWGRGPGARTVTGRRHGPGRLTSAHALTRAPPRPQVTREGPAASRPGPQPLPRGRAPPLPRPSPSRDRPPGCPPGCPIRAAAPRPRSRCARDPAGWHMRRARAARRGRRVTLAWRAWMEVCVVCGPGGPWAAPPSPPFSSS